MGRQRRGERHKGARLRCRAEGAIARSGPCEEGGGGREAAGGSGRRGERHRGGGIGVHSARRYRRTRCTTVRVLSHAYSVVIVLYVVCFVAALLLLRLPLLRDGGGLMACMCEVINFSLLSFVPNFVLCVPTDDATLS